MEKSTDPDQMASSADSLSGSTVHCFLMICPSSAGQGLYIFVEFFNIIRILSVDSS